MKKLLQKQDYSPEIERCNTIIRSAKNLEGLSEVKQWKEIVQHINDRIEGLKRGRDNLLCGGNKDIEPERELAEVKAIAREIRALEEIRDIEQSYSKVLTETLKKKRQLEELAKKQEEQPKKRKYPY